MTESQILLHPTGKQIVTSDSGYALFLDMLKPGPGRLRKQYNARGCLKILDQKTLRKLNNFIVVRKRDYVRLIQKPHDTETAELLRKEPKEMNGLVGGPRSENENQRRIVNARCEEIHYSEPKYLELPHLDLYMPLGKFKNE